MPMEKIDNKSLLNSIAKDNPEGDDELVMNHVIQDDHELFYLHVCLNEILSKVKEEQLA